ncbi:MAG TPA: FAD-binding oxidoreductase [Solirubrobacteraceae bacterium]|jgi:alkyldihydroxyacetonephosphate synthase|nr:FAD-binding oxidoreductase [Solirubrobacteraceae bacterium]
MRQRKHWGWGFADEQPSQDELRAAAAGIAEVFGFGARDVEAPVPLEAAALPEPRIAPPPGADVSAHARASHAWGKSYSDVVRGFRGRFDHAPDAVLRPADEREVEAALEWAAREGVAVIPYGGGTSVVGGVTPAVDGPAVSLDLSRLDRVLEVDAVSGAARIQAGALGPALEAQLGEHGLTLRHFPQSFEFSTLGGWIATRAGGHFATVETHVDDLVESIRAVTPSGTWESRRLPGSGAGPSPDRLLLGSEGVLGVITEAWVRVRPRPVHRRSAGAAFPAFERGAEAVRELSQSGLHPSNCRLIDALEARYTGTGDGSSAMLVLGFESGDEGGRAALDARMDRALAIVRDHGGEPEERDGGGGGAVGSWRSAFLRAPYVRDTFVACGVLSDTFETAITWERFPAFHEQVMAAAREAAGERAHVSCRFTHVYPDGPAPYYTIIAPADRGSEVEQWAQIKAAAADALIAAGGTITHHHAVGRDHRPWYDRQRPDPFAAALRGAKGAVDPAGIMNPGVLLDP